MGLFDNLFGTRKDTSSLTEMMTDEQKQAQSILAKLAQTGQVGGINTGDQYTGSLGNFTATPTEGMAVNRIYDLLNSGTPSALAKAEDILTKMADTTFDPSDPSSGYAAYQRQVARAQKDADDVINRESAITGNRFGDRILNTKADLAMQGQDMLSTKLADLYNTAQDRSLAGAQGLTNLANVQSGIDMNNITAASQLGGLQRMLDTAKAQAQYGEWKRARNERLGAVTGAANSLWNKNVDYGMKDYTTKSPSTFMKMLGEVSPAVGSYNTQKYGYDTNQTSLPDGINLLAEMFL